MLDRSASPASGESTSIWIIVGHQQGVGDLVLARSPSTTPTGVNIGTMTWVQPRAVADRPGGEVGEVEHRRGVQEASVPRR